MTKKGGGGGGVGSSTSSPSLFLSKSFKEGDLVFAKVRGYPAWPARITEADKAGVKFKVLFFATYETAAVKKAEIWHYDEQSKTKFGGKQQMKRKGFAEAMAEIETNPFVQQVSFVEPQPAREEPVEAAEGSAGAAAGPDGVGGVGGDAGAAAAAAEGGEGEPVPSSGGDENHGDENEEEDDDDDDYDEGGPLTIDDKAAVVDEVKNVNADEKPPKSKGTKRKAAEEANRSVAEPPSKQPRRSSGAAANKGGPAAALAAATTSTPNKRALKRKSSGAAVALENHPASASPATAAATPSSVEIASTPLGGTPATGSKTSRSGRVIKPKKFDDEDDGINAATTPVLLKAAAAATPSSTSPAVQTNLVVASGGNSGKISENSKDAKKMWVEVKSTGYVLEINLDKDRPVSFDSKDAEIQWERATAKNALKFKEAVESGKYIPEEIRVKLEQKVVRTPQEEEVLAKERQAALRREKVRWLKSEQRLIDIDIAIKTAVHYEHPDMTRCLELLDELAQMAIAPLMLKKHPDIVTTLRKLRKYIGPQSEPEDPKVAEEWIANAEKIRLKADAVFHKIRSYFALPEGAATSFWDTFEQSVLEFRHATRDMDRGQLLHLVVDPTAAAAKKGAAAAAAASSKKVAVAT